MAGLQNNLLINWIVIHFNNGQYLLSAKFICQALL